MVYFDIRPSAHLPTVELRVCDACPEVDDVVLIAGLFRALVGKAREDLDAGLPLPESRHELLRAASWRAARSGLEGDLVDLVGPSLVPPPLLVGRLVDQLRPQLEELGDWEQVLELSQATLARGSARRRASAARSAAAASSPTSSTPCSRTPRAARRPASRPRPSRRTPELLVGYHPGRAAAFDEAVSAGGTVLPHYGWMFRTLDRLGPRGMAAAESALRTEQRARGVTFRVGDGEPDRLFPLDLVPRIVTAEDWAGLTAGLAQRVRALEAFLRDVYGERRIVADGVVPAPVVDDAPGRSRLGKLVPADAVRIAVAGIDLVRDRADHWLVLEDNLRVPSGIGYSIMSRRLIRSVMPDLEPPAGVVGLEPVPGQLRSALLSATEPDEPGHDEVAAALGRPGRLGVLRAPAAGRADGHPAGHAARPAGHRGRRVPRGHRGPAAAVRPLPADRRARAARAPPAPTCARSAARCATRWPGARSRCSTRWATAWPTTSSSTPTCRR